MNEASLERLLEKVEEAVKGSCREEIIGVLMAVVSQHIGTSPYAAQWWAFLISRCISELNGVLADEGEWLEVNLERHQQEPLTRYLQ